MIGIGDIRMFLRTHSVAGDDVAGGEDVESGADDAHIHGGADEDGGYRVFDGLDLETFAFFQVTSCQGWSGRLMRSPASSSMNQSRRDFGWLRNGVRSLIHSTRSATASLRSSISAKCRSVR